MRSRETNPFYFHSDGRMTRQYAARKRTARQSERIAA